MEDADFTDRVNAAVRAVRDELTAELLPQLREELRVQLGPQVREELRAELSSVMAGALNTFREIAAEEARIAAHDAALMMRANLAGQEGPDVSPLAAGGEGPVMLRLRQVLVVMDEVRRLLDRLVGDGATESAEAVPAQRS